MSIELKGVVKQLDGETHIYETNLKLAEGGFNVLLGTTLAGKTTLMRLMAGLELPSAGEICFNGKNVTGVPVQKRSVAMVYQAFVNYPNFSVFDNIASPLKVQRIAKAEIKSRVEAIADLLQLGPMLQRLPQELSGGQQQRTALARALVKNAELVLLDEPLANLDYKLREELREELPRLFADSGATVVYATSEPAEALLLGGHTATMHCGRVIEYGDTAQVYRRPGNMISAAVFTDPPINTIMVKKQGEMINLDERVSWQVPQSHHGLDDGDYQLGIRPHHLTPYPDTENSAAITGQVKIVEISGSASLIHLQFKDNHWVSESPGVHPCSVGDSITLYINIKHCLLFDANGLALSKDQKPEASEQRE